MHLVCKLKEKLIRLKKTLCLLTTSRNGPSRFFSPSVIKAAKRSLGKVPACQWRRSEFPWSGPLQWCSIQDKLSNRGFINHVKLSLYETFEQPFPPKDRANDNSKLHVDLPNSPLFIQNMSPQCKINIFLEKINFSGWS